MKNNNTPLITMAAFLLGCTLHATAQQETAIKPLAPAAEQSNDPVPNRMPQADSPLIFEDFSKFTAGSETTPDGTDLAPYGDMMLDDKYMQQPGWQGGAIYQAGGVCYIGFQTNYTGWLTLPTVDLTAEMGVFTISFRAKSAAAEGDEVVIGHFFEHTPGLAETVFVPITNEWADYSVTIEGGTDKHKIQISTKQKEWFVDNINLTTGASGNNLITPTPSPCSDFTEHSFTANWQPVDGADGYRIRVYRYEEAAITYKPLDVMTKDVDGTSFNVTGIEPMTYTYFYKVAAKKGDLISEESSEQVAHPTMNKPLAKAASDITANSFTANWEAVPFAQLYRVQLHKELLPQTNAPATLVSANFDDVTTATGTIDKPEQTFQPYYLPGVSNWYIYTASKVNGMIGIDNVLGEQYGTSFLASPELDFSVGGGKTTVHLKWMGLSANSAYVTFGTIDPNTKRIVPDKSEAIALPVELEEADITIEGGRKNCRLLIYTNEAGMIMLDELRITTELKAGESLLMPIANAQTAGTSQKFENLVYQEGARFAYDISAAYCADYIAPLTSDYSDMQYVNLKSGINEASAAEARAYTHDGLIHIENPNGEAVSVYDINGTCLLHNNTGDLHLTLDAAPAGVYLVRIGGKTCKVLL